MKVGILSMQRVKNWGSFLQAFALKKSIEDLGYECSFLDIKPGVGLKPCEMTRVKNNRIISVFRKLGLLIYYCMTGQLLVHLKSKSYQKKFKTKYNKKFLPILGVDEFKYEYDKSFDLLIIGSDEVFNCTQPTSPWGKTLHLFGEGIKAEKIITYAASFGYTTIADLEKHGLKEKIANALKNISTFSVRDMNSYSIIAQLTGKKPELCVDPVIMYDFSSYMPEKVPIENYLIIYTYHGRKVDADIIKAIKKFAASRNKIIISLYGYYNWCDQSIIADTPFELLAYFAHADYVVTDTFHGTIFSIKFNRNFCTVVRNTNAQKLESLLDQFKLTNRIVKTPSDIKRMLEKEIDYTDVNSIIRTETIKAKTYLKNAIH
jgi:polysaccharide pyruvyl transferase WcaK-like protein